MDENVIDIVCHDEYRLNYRLKKKTDYIMDLTLENFMKNYLFTGIDFLHLQLQLTKNSL